METFAGKNGSAILLMLPKDISSQVMDWAGKNIPPDKLSGLPNKGYDKSPHITLAAGIIDETPEKAFNLLEKQGPFSVVLGDVDAFRKHEKGYDVIKIAAKSPTLNSLNSSILQELEVNNPVDPFNPHITLAYVRPMSCENLLGNQEFKGTEVPIERYVYSDRQYGGRVVNLGNREPLKESLDYGSRDSEYSIKDIADFLKKDALFVQSMTSVNIARTVIAILHSNKIA